MRLRLIVGLCLALFVTASPVVAQQAGAPAPADSRSVAEVLTADLLQAASDAGNAEASETLARMYLEGQGVPKDEARAVALYAKGAQAGRAESENMYGV